MLVHHMPARSLKGSSLTFILCFCLSHQGWQAVAMPKGVYDAPGFDDNNVGTTSASSPNRQQANTAESGDVPPAGNDPHPNHSTSSSNAGPSHQAHSNQQQHTAEMDDNPPVA
eukprot:15300999-Ditylum_brightwellii.AAC.1